MNRQTLEEATISTNKDLEDDYTPTNPTIEELRQMSVDVRTGHVKTIPWEQVKAELHAIQD